MQQDSCCNRLPYFYSVEEPCIGNEAETIVYSFYHQLIAMLYDHVTSHGGVPLIPGTATVEFFTTSLLYSNRKLG